MRGGRRFLAPALLACALGGHAQERGNPFDDPFQQATAGYPGCPPAAPPGYTAEETRREAHVRAEHGTSCHRSGRCRLPNSYQYDREIIPRVVHYLRQDGRFDDTAVWVLGQRRLVTLSGCVRSRQQADALERAVLQVDDVAGVINLLHVGLPRGSALPRR